MDPTKRQRDSITSDTFRSFESGTLFFSPQKGLGYFPLCGPSPGMIGDIPSRSQGFFEKICFGSILPSGPG
jgi:hypothetical protein